MAYFFQDFLLFVIFSSITRLMSGSQGLYCVELFAVECVVFTVLSGGCGGAGRAGRLYPSGG